MEFGPDDLVVDMALNRSPCMQNKSVIPKATLTALPVEFPVSTVANSGEKLAEAQAKAVREGDAVFRWLWEHLPCGTMDRLIVLFKDPSVTTLQVDDGEEIKLPKAGEAEVL